MAKVIVAGDEYYELDGQLLEIKRQLRQPDGYPFEPKDLRRCLQDIIEGKFGGKQPQQVVISVAPHLFPVSETNMEEMITVTERFTRKVLGQRVNLREMFTFPTELPWKDVSAIFDPCLNNRQAVEKALQGQKLTVWEYKDVMGYSRSEASAKPTLHIIENSIRPSTDTLGDFAKSPRQLNSDGRTYLGQRGYALAFGLRYFKFRDYLDPETWTWFPGCLSGGGVACGGWSPGPGYREVRFCCGDAGCVDAGCGARLAIAVSLKT